MADYDPDSYWEAVSAAYPHYPTVRHRWRFILAQLGDVGLSSGSFVYDYGCGDGSLLGLLQRRFALAGANVGGCDVSTSALRLARARTDSPHLSHEDPPTLGRRCDAIICCEVIEHLTDYARVLAWIREHLVPGGRLILTTQAGRIHASDRYTGHTQHFVLDRLVRELEGMGFDVPYRRLWGFPFFTLQKYLTNVDFERTKRDYLEGQVSLRKRLVFAVAYWLYAVHDLLPLGPQILVHAVRR